LAKTPRAYTREFKLKAERLYEATDKIMAHVERELGTTPYLLSRWVKQFREKEPPILSVVFFQGL
jgi:transposase-like protein